MDQSQTAIAEPINASPVHVITAGHARPAGKILLATGNRLNQKVAVRMLQSSPHQVTIVTTGGQVLSALLHGKFDMVLMDSEMPEMSGVEATQLIRANEVATGGHIPIVAMTSSAALRDACLHAGMDQHITKPLNFDQLRQVIDAFGFRRPHMGDTSALDRLDGLVRLGADLPGVLRYLRELFDSFDAHFAIKDSGEHYIFKSFWVRPGIGGELVAHPHLSPAGAQFGLLRYRARTVYMPRQLDIKLGLFSGIEHGCDYVLRISNKRSERGLACARFGTGLGIPEVELGLICGSRARPGAKSNLPGRFAGWRRVFVDLSNFYIVRIDGRIEEVVAHSRLTLVCILRQEVGVRDCTLIIQGISIVPDIVLTHVKRQQLDRTRKRYRDVAIPRQKTLVRILGRRGEGNILCGNQSRPIDLHSRSRNRLGRTAMRSLGDERQPQGNKKSYATCERPSRRVLAALMVKRSFRDVHSNIVAAWRLRLMGC
jgi:CheY-like chemotaxis protein